MDEEKKNDTPEDTAPEDTAQEDDAQEDGAQEDAAGGDVLAIVSELNDKIDAILVMLRNASADKASRFEKNDEPAKPASLY